MEKKLAFKFMDEDLHSRLLGLLKKAKVPHEVDRDGVIHYSRTDEQVVGNTLIRSIRNAIFPEWQLLSCPADYVDRFRRYMTGHGIAFQEELVNRQLGFLLPRKYRPHSWRLSEEDQPDGLEPQRRRAAVRPRAARAASRSSQ